MVDARQLFDSMPRRNHESWNALISGYNQNLMFMSSWETFCGMFSSSVKLSAATFFEALSACCGLGSLSSGEQVYSLVLKNGYFSDRHVRSRMIDLCLKCSKFEDGLRVFRDDSSCRNSLCWSSVICGAVQVGENSVGLELFRRMFSSSLAPNRFVFISILKACASLGEFEIGRGVHGLAIKYGIEEALIVGNAIIDLYAKFRMMGESVKKLLEMPKRSIASWTTVISGFMNKEDYVSALEFFRDMRLLGERFNEFTLTSIISGCGQTGMLKEGTQIHSLIVKTGFFLDSSVSATLISMYSKLGSVDSSETVFAENLNLKNPSSCEFTAMMGSLCEKRDFKSAAELFCWMLKEGLRPEELCTSSMLRILESLYLGKQIHCYAVKTGLCCDSAVRCSLATMYSNSKCVDDSEKVFHEVSDNDNFALTSLISTFADHGFSHRSLKLFGETLRQGLEPDGATLSAILATCSTLHSIRSGKEIHGYALRLGFENARDVGNTLVNMYSKCGALELAKRVFDKMIQKDEITYTTLISRHAQNGFLKKAFSLFRDLLVADLSINSFVISCVLSAIDSHGRPKIGTQVHALVMKTGLHSNSKVGSSLVMMYSKSGCIEDYIKAFNQISEPDVICWTAMIMSHNHYNKGAEALSLYKLMRVRGIKPDSLTLLGVLCACSIDGLVDAAYSYFNSMAKVCGVGPDTRHYNAMVVLLSRKGRLNEAKMLIDKMPFEPNCLLWGSLLFGCEVHGDTVLGELASKKILELNPSNENARAYLSSIGTVRGFKKDSSGFGIDRVINFSHHELNLL